MERMYHPELFADKVALVTGGRSGIGYAIAQHYLQLGAKVVIASRKEDKLNEAAAELSQLGTCKAKTCDIRQVEEVESLAAFIKDEFGQLDILVNNAGGQFPALAEAISPRGWNAVINNNLNGTFYVSQIMASEFFIPQQSGVIVNIIASIYRGFPGMAHTGAARAGVDNLTKTLGQEWASHGIRVNAIAPGVIESSGLDTYPTPMKAFFDDLKKENLMGRLGTVDDVANAAMFFSSPLSSYISGTTLYVDGLEHLSMDGTRLTKILKSFL